MSLAGTLEIISPSERFERDALVCRLLGVSLHRWQHWAGSFFLYRHFKFLWGQLVFKNMASGGGDMSYWSVAMENKPFAILQLFGR